MDLKAIVNTEDRQQNAALTTSLPHVKEIAPPPSTPSSYSSSNHQAPSYPPQASSFSTHSQGLTPLRPPSQRGTSDSYPYLQSATQQSPITQHYRPFESQPATTPSRPASHGYSYQHPHPPAPAGHIGQTFMQQQQQQSAHTYSISPTPPSHPSRTPGSLRQSPMSTMSSMPSQQQHHQRSQPNTPLGPPPPHLPRAPTHDMQSPFHARTFSGASNHGGIVSGSPAQHHPSIGNLVESPNAYNRPSPHATQRVSEYAGGRSERQHSASVSPKTVLPRLPSIGSQPSVQHQESFTSRTSQQYNSTPSVAASPSHVRRPSAAATSMEPQTLVAASEMPQINNPPRPTPNFPQQSSLSQASGAQPPPANIQHHQTRKISMSHLVTPASEIPPTAVTSEVKQETGTSTPPGGAVSTPTLGRNTPDIIMPDAQSQQAHKRSAQCDIEEPPAKQQKTRKYKERPIWARLSKHNPKFAQQGPMSDPKGAMNGASSNQSGQQKQTRVNGAGKCPNGAQRSNLTPQPPTQQQQHDPDVCIDEELMLARRNIPGWQRSFTGAAPLPDLTRRVADWMFLELAQLKDVGNDPREGTVEIEAKVGNLLQNESQDRCKLPVRSSTVVDAEECRRHYHFESRMDEVEHKFMNEYLNSELRAAAESKTRTKMAYQHYTDLDSFQTLSPAGLSALPPAILNRADRRRPPKLRTTTRTEKNKQPRVVARIVKIPIANLQIFNPNDDYDLRISINVECNLDRPDININEIIAEDKPTLQSSPDRRKDRVSYTHLAYQIDLTRVDIAGLRAKYELEVEVDAGVLRGQMDLFAQGRQDHSFGPVVAGLLDNAALLTRQRAPR